MVVACVVEDESLRQMMKVGVIIKADEPQQPHSNPGGTNRLNGALFMLCLCIENWDNDSRTWPNDGVYPNSFRCRNRKIWTYLSHLYSAPFHCNHKLSVTSM